MTQRKISARICVILSFIAAAAGSAVSPALASTGGADAPRQLVHGNETTLGAVVDSGGALVRGSAQSATRLGPGRYEVTFKNNVSNCAYTATIGDPNNQLVYNPYLIYTAGGHQSSRGVYVETKNLGGGLSDAPFHLNVTCRN
jgi:hypothetical protein